jgi:hypothetical protein
MKEIRFMPRKEMYLQSDIRTVTVSDHEAKGVWDSIGANTALWKSVYAVLDNGQTKIETVKDFRHCVNCSELLQYCTCGKREAGLITVKGGERLPSQAASTREFINRITERKGLNHGTYN